MKIICSTLIQTLLQEINLKDLVRGKPFEMTKSDRYSNRMFNACNLFGVMKFCADIKGVLIKNI